jgi:hypothetical protein
MIQDTRDKTQETTLDPKAPMSSNYLFHAASAPRQQPHDLNSARWDAATGQPDPEPEAFFSVFGDETSLRSPWGVISDDFIQFLFDESQSHDSTSINSANLNRDAYSR